MAKHIASGYRKARGFTLVELMIVVVIVAILASIAIPAYNAQIRKSRRTEAKTTLLDLAAREEKFYNTNPTSGYTNLPANVGYTSASPTFTAIPVGSGYYTVTITPVPADNTTTPPTPASYTIAATPTGDQAKDTQCTQFTLASTGQQTATGSATASVDCWK